MSARPYSEIPRVGSASVLVTAVSTNFGRYGMRRHLEALHREKGPLVVQGIAPLRFVNLFGPDANRFVLLDREGTFSSRRPWMRIMGGVFPNGLLLLDGERHRHHRKLMREAFKRPVLREYVRRMNPMIAEGLAAWPKRGALRAFPALKELTLGIASRIFVGMELGPEARNMNEAFEGMVAASMPGGIRLPLPGLEYNRGLRGRAFMLRLLGRMLPQRRAGGAGDMLSRLCRARGEEGEALSDSEILDHMVFLMMAAHDTTTSTLTSTIWELARHPEWQERVRQESRDLGEAQPDFDALDRLDALDRVMRETLRRYPPLPVIPRAALRDFEWEGYRIPAGSMVVVSPIHTHHMREWWSDPERFDPDRFGPERAEDRRHTHSWIPFGGGVHMCLGKRFAEAQIRLILHQLVLRTRWSVEEGYEMPVQEAPISKPRDGLPVRLEPLH